MHSYRLGRMRNSSRKSRVIIAALIIVLIILSSSPFITQTRAQVYLRHPPMLEEFPITLKEIDVYQPLGGVLEPELLYSALAGLSSFIQAYPFLFGLLEQSNTSIGVNISLTSAGIKGYPNMYIDINYYSVIYVERNGEKPVAIGAYTGEIKVSYDNVSQTMSALLPFVNGITYARDIVYAPVNETRAINFANNLSLVSYFSDLYAKHAVLSNIGYKLNNYINNITNNYNNYYIVYNGSALKTLVSDQAAENMASTIIPWINELSKIKIIIVNETKKSTRQETNPLVCYGLLELGREKYNNSQAYEAEVDAVKTVFGDLTNVYSVGFNIVDYINIMMYNIPILYSLFFNDPICIDSYHAINSTALSMLLGILGSKLVLEVFKLFNTSEYKALFPIYITPIYIVNNAFRTSALAPYIYGIANSSGLYSPVSRTNNTSLSNIPPELANIVVNITSGNETSALNALDQARKLLEEGKIDEKTYNEILNIFAGEYGEIPPGYANVGGGEDKVNLNNLLNEINNINNKNLSIGTGVNSTNIPKPPQGFSKLLQKIRNSLGKLRNNAGIATAFLAVPLIGVAIAYASREVDLSGPVGLIRVFTKKPPRGLSGRELAKWCYKIILYYLSLKGLVKQEWETPREFLERASKHLDPAWISLLEKITNAYEKARYGLEEDFTYQDANECLEELRRMILPWG